MPSSQFIFPKITDVIQEFQTFTVKMAITNMETGDFTNPNTNYFAAPQFLVNGFISGHSHITIQLIPNGPNQTTPIDPVDFAFFKGLNVKDKGGILTADVVGGLPAGFYRVSSLNTAANHQPVVMPVAQRGATDDNSLVSCLSP